jgi:vancomycin resistance protein VanJ
MGSTMADAATGRTPQGNRWRRLPGTRRWGRDARGRSTWRRGWIIALLALCVAFLLAFHSAVPDSFGNFGSLLETFLPWVGLGVPVLLVPALLRRSATALVVLLLPTALWFNLFGALLTDKSGGPYDFTVVQHNVWAYNKDIPLTVRVLEAAHADVISLVEVSSTELPVFEHDLAGEYPYRAVEGTVGLWSKDPLTDTEPVDIQIGWVRALRTTVETPQGAVAVYVAHMPSVRVKFDDGFTANQRDVSANALGLALAQEKLPRVILLGDLNGTMNDRSLAPITSQMRSAQGSAGAGFGFSYPAQFPMARIDQILTRGVTPADAWTLPRTGSDHLPIAAHLEL